MQTATATPTAPAAPLVVRLRDIMPNNLTVGDTARKARALLALHRIYQAAAREALAELAADRQRAAEELYTARNSPAVPDFTATVVTDPRNVLGPAWPATRSAAVTYTPAGRIRRLVGAGPVRVVR